jgi:hypothetical protein
MAKRRAKRSKKANLKSTAIYIDARKLASEGRVVQVPQSMEYGVMCIPTPPQSDGEWQDLHEFAQFIVDMENEDEPDQSTDRELIATS